MNHTFAIRKKNENRPAHAYWPGFHPGVPGGTRFHVPVIVPGLALTALVALAAMGLRQIPGLSAFSPMILAILIGIGLHNLFGTPAFAKPGIVFSMRRILRFAIVLLGLQLTAQQVVAVGAMGIAIIAVTLISTFVFTKWLGRLLGVDCKLAELVAAGTSICGASAVIAANTVTKASDEDIAYSVACVTVFGSIAMFAYPLLPGILHLTPEAYGLWTGASIHEIAQVVAAAYQDGQRAGDFGTIAKLSRVMMLAPMVLALGFLPHRKGSGKDGNMDGNGRVPVPWFVFGFVALVIVNSIASIPLEARTLIVAITTFMLTMALAAMGLETDLRKLKAKGLRPLLLGRAASLFIAGFSLSLIELFLV